MEAPHAGGWTQERDHHHTPRRISQAQNGVMDAARRIGASHRRVASARRIGAVREQCVCMMAGEKSAHKVLESRARRPYNPPS
jgi:hypothetical protein